MKRLQKIVSILTKITGIMANIVIFLTMAVVSLSVLMRILFNTPIPGLTDIVSMLNALAVAFAISIAEKHRKHIRVDFVREYLPPMMGKAIFFFMNSLAIVVICAVAYRFLLYGFSAYSHGNATWIMNIPHWPVIACLFVGLIIFLLTAISNLLSDFSNWKEAK